MRTCFLIFSVILLPCKRKFTSYCRLTIRIYDAHSLTGDVPNLKMLFLVKVSRLGWRMGCVEPYSSEVSSRPRAQACSVDALLYDGTIRNFQTIYPTLHCLTHLLIENIHLNLCHTHWPMLILNTNH